MLFRSTLPAPERPRNRIYKPARSLRQFASLLSTFPPLAGVAAETSRSIKPRERDLRDLRLFVLVRFFTRPTNRPRHAACASNFKSKPVRPRKLREVNITDRPDIEMQALGVANDSFWLDRVLSTKACPRQSPSLWEATVHLASFRKRSQAVSFLRVTNIKY